jgi:hypothetical protein
MNNPSCLCVYKVESKSYCYRKTNKKNNGKPVSIYWNRDCHNSKTFAPTVVLPLVYETL